MLVWPMKLFGAICLDVRTLTFCQLIGFIKPLKAKLLAGGAESNRELIPRHLKTQQPTCLATPWKGDWWRKIILAGSRGRE